MDKDKQAEIERILESLQNLLNGERTEYVVEAMLVLIANITCTHVTEDKIDAQADNVIYFYRMAVKEARGNATLEWKSLN